MYIRNVIILTLLVLFAGCETPHVSPPLSDTPVYEQEYWRQSKIDSIYREMVKARSSKYSYPYPKKWFSSNPPKQLQDDVVLKAKHLYENNNQ